MDVSELIRKEGLRRGLSHQTIRTYRYCVRKFFNWCRKEPNEIKKADIKSYLDKMIEKGACGNTINVHLNALKFFYCDILMPVNRVIPTSEAELELPSSPRERRVFGFGYFDEKKSLRMNINAIKNIGLKIRDIKEFFIISPTVDLSFNLDTNPVTKQTRKDVITIHANITRNPSIP